MWRWHSFTQSSSNGWLLLLFFLQKQLKNPLPLCKYLAKFFRSLLAEMKWLGRVEPNWAEVSSSIDLFTIGLLSKVVATSSALIWVAKDPLKTRERTNERCCKQAHTYLQSVFQNVQQYPSRAAAAAAQHLNLILLDWWRIWLIPNNWRFTHFVCTDEAASSCVQNERESERKPARRKNNLLLLLLFEAATRK